MKKQHKYTKRQLDKHRREANKKIEKYNNGYDWRLAKNNHDTTNNAKF